MYSLHSLSNNTRVTCRLQQGGRPPRLHSDRKAAVPRRSLTWRQADVSWINNSSGGNIYTTYIYIFMSEYIYIKICINIYICINKNIYICINAYIYMYKCIYIYTLKYLYIYGYPPLSYISLVFTVNNALRMHNEKRHFSRIT